MTPIALIIKHRTLPGRCDDVHKGWLEHTVPAIAANPDHAAYFYLLNETDPDVICAFQLYASLGVSGLSQNGGLRGLSERGRALLSGLPQVMLRTLVWKKGWAGGTSRLKRLKEGEFSLGLTLKATTSFS